MKRTFLSLALLFPLIASADPAPFGLEIGKTEIKDVKSKYGAKRTGTNDYSKGEMYELDVGDLGFQGLKRCTAIFDKDGKLAAILATLSKNRFDELFKTLRGKYELHSSEIPFVGNKSAQFRDGSTRIMLDAPHMSFDMEMSYVRNDLWRAYQEKSRQGERKKKQKEAAQL